MINTTNNYKTAVNASKRQMKAKAELYNSSSLVSTFTENDRIKSITIERVGEESKFFGFGVAHKYNIKLIDVERAINLTTDHYFKISLGLVLSDNTEYISYPKAYITEVNRDENTNELSITAYDLLKDTKTLTVSDLDITTPYTIKDVVKAVGDKIGTSETITGKNLWDNNYTTGIPAGYIEKTKTGFNFTRGDLTGGRNVSPTNISVKAGETYTFSCDAESTGQVGVQLFIYKEAPYGEVIKRVDGNVITHTFEEDTDVSFTIIINSTVLTLNVSNIQIEKNTVRTNYEPYVDNFDLEYPDGANFDGTESLEEVLRAAAEATQTIYFINGNDALVFKRLDKDGTASKEITKNDYIKLDSKTNRRLATICNCTELGDNVSSSKLEPSTQTISLDLGDNELCSIGDIKDELIINNKKGTIKKNIGKVILNGSESTNSFEQLSSIMANTTRFIYNLNGVAKITNNLIGAYSTHFKAASFDEIYTTNTTDKNLISLNSGVSRFVFRIETSIANTINEFKTFLQEQYNNGTPVTVYYELAEPYTIEVDTSGYNLADGVYYGESIQETSVQGKNYFTGNKISNGKGVGITYNFDNSIIKLNGTSTASATIMDGFTKITLPAGTYTYYLGLKSGSFTLNGKDLAIYLRSSDAFITGSAATSGNTLGDIKSTGSTKKTFTITEEKDLYIRMFVNGAGLVCEDLELYLQIEKGSSYTGFEQFIPNSPSPDYSSEIFNKETIDANILRSITGTTQYLRDNPFLDLRDDTATILDNAIEEIGGFTLNQFNCNWRGDLSVEVGDKIELTTKDNQTVISYLLNDSIEYDGALTQKTEWNYTESEETESNPTSLGDVLKQTYAKVNKAEKTIDLVASEVSANKDALAALQINTDSVNASVQNIERATTEALETVNSNISTLTERVNATITAEEVSIEVQKKLSEGVSSVETSTGFTFNENGLHISKTGSEMETSVDEDGIKVYRDNEEVLTANNEGVIAYDLHAKTYLIVGTNSRFEDYTKDGEARTGCFWIGETEVE